jgi:hypothetical protein
VGSYLSEVDMTVALIYVTIYALASMPCREDIYTLYTHLSDMQVILDNRKV